MCLRKLWTLLGKEKNMPRSEGNDISKWQVFFDPTLTTELQEFIIQRASWAGYPDELFEEMFVGVSQFPLRGAYHYYSSGIPWLQQAELFKSQVLGRGFRCLVVDYETKYNNLTERTALELLAFLRWLRDEFPGVQIMVYTSVFIYRDYIEPWAPEVAEFPWWVARFPNTVDPQVDAPDLQEEGLERTDWTFWQYSSKGDGKKYGVGSEFIDLNVFNGTTDELAQFWSFTPPPPFDDCNAEKKAILQEVIDLVTNLQNQL